MRRNRAHTYDYDPDETTDHGDYYEDKPAFNLWDTPERLAEYERIKANHLAYGADIGREIHEIPGWNNPVPIKSSGVCRHCYGMGDYRDQGETIPCPWCDGSGYRASVRVADASAAVLEAAFVALNKQTPIGAPPHPQTAHCEAAGPSSSRPGST